MRCGLSQQQLDIYHRDGIIFPVQVFSTDEVSQYRNALNLLIDNRFGGSIKRVDNLHLFFNWAFHLAANDKLVDAAESILGGDILIYATLIFSKPPRDSSYVSWHQDSFYSNLSLTPSVSAWVALATSNPDTGCVRAIPGSHKLGALNHGNDNDEANLLQRGECVEFAVDESKAVDVILQPGEVSLHQSNVIHGSNPNRMSEARTGFIVRYVTSEFICPRGLRLLRVRGDGDCSHSDTAQPPNEVDQGSAFAAWHDFTEASAEMRGTK